MNTTPYELRILIDVYVGAEITANQSLELFAQTIEKLCERELIRPLGNEVRPIGREYAPTEKLNVLMHHILTAPDPVWKMP